MPIPSKSRNDWVDGFLFVGNHLALDFLNTRPVSAKGPTELLPDVDALLRWLITSDVLTRQNGKALARKWSGTPQATVFLRDLLKFRERLRTAVIRQEAGLPVSDAFIAELNSLLKRHPSVIALQRNRNKLGLAAAFKPRKPNDLWVPIANAVADLLSDALLERVRKCEGCIVHFLDTSKKGSRRWCSMNICGNKIKVAAYQRRMRAGRKKIRRRVNGS